MRFEARVAPCLEPVTVGIREVGSPADAMIHWVNLDALTRKMLNNFLANAALFYTSSAR
jgi:hypothetical protein